jgi:hypothetical protein
VALSAYKIGDKVWVNGFGHGEVVRVGGASSQYEHDVYYTVASHRDCQCDCGHVHTRRDTTRAEAIHMSRRQT